MKYYECHGHIALGNGTIKEKLKLLADAGAVYFRDGGANEDLYRKSFDKLGISTFDVKEIAPTIKYIAQDMGIEYKTPIYAFYKEGLYGKFLGKSFSSTKDLYKQILDAKKIGADFIKVMYSGIASFKEIGKLSCSPIGGNDIKEIVKICHGEGMAVMAHCNGADTIKYAIEYGTDSIEHGIFIDEEGIKMLCQSEGKSIWVPTIVAIANKTLQDNHKNSVKRAISLGAVVALGSDCGCSSVNFEDGSRIETEFLLSVGDALEENCKKLKGIFA